MYYNKDGEALNLSFENEDEREMLLKLWSDDNRRVAVTEYDGVCVSTVFLPIDHGFGQEPPLIYETMIFGLPGEKEYQWRYATEVEALRGHLTVLDAVLSGSDPYAAMA